MNRLAIEQSKRNAASRGRWELFRSHRDEVTKHLTRGFKAGAGRICVLGAGNCNDLDLDSLCDTFKEVHLVDIDAAALADGVAEQEMSGRDDVVLHGPLDVTGVYDELAAWIDDAEISAPRIDRCLRRAEEFSDHNLPAPFDVSASVCLLSQIIDCVARAMGDGHPRFAETMLALRRRHLRLLWELLSPGGWGVLVTDFVSSATCPELAEIPAEKFPARMRELIRQGNFFHGVNPSALVGALGDDPMLAEGIAGCQLVRPWRWNFGPRVYAVCALKFQRGK